MICEFWPKEVVNLNRFLWKLECAHKPFGLNSMQILKCVQQYLRVVVLRNYGFFTGNSLLILFCLKATTIAVCVYLRSENLFYFKLSCIQTLNPKKISAMIITFEILEQNFMMSEKKSSAWCFFIKMTKNHA